MLVIFYVGVLGHIIGYIITEQGNELFSLDTENCSKLCW